MTFTLGANVENLALTGSASINATGNALNNVLTGNSSANRLDGGAGADFLRAGVGNDTVLGGEGNDVLFGELGSDLLTGGPGSDVFVFDAPVGVSVDTITDFEVIADKIQLDDDIFNALGVVGTATGVALPAIRFQLGASANDSADRIVYNQSTGQLFYDPDGNGAAAQQQIALIGVSTHPALTASHFLVIA